MGEYTKIRGIDGLSNPHLSKIETRRMNTFENKIRVPEHLSYFLETAKGSIKTWATLDATAKWVRSLGIGSMHLDVSRWQPGQKGLPI